MSLSGVGTALVTSLLAQTGSNWTYTQANTTGTLSLYKGDLPPVIVDNGMGQVTEIIMASFRGLRSDFEALCANPLRGDKLTDGTTTYNVQPILDKCFYTVGGMIHIHAKRVSG
jgi:hypothetical protein